jgi:hypothetical protein
MNENADFIAKLRDIEEQAHSLAVMLGETLERTRAQHIVLVSRALRGRLELGALNVVRNDTGAARSTSE